MPALLLENIPTNVYRKLSYEADSKNMSVAQQVIVFIEKGLSSKKNASKNEIVSELKSFQRSMKGAAEKANFSSPDDVEAYIKAQRVLN
jgi:tRNA A-37 threonylcarbamoyl transferase component Bud32